MKRPLWDPTLGIFIFPLGGLQRIGSNYGGWTIPVRMLNRNSICYCIGTGEDITFDLGLIDRFRCHVFACDPTPRAIAYVGQTAGKNDLYHFFPVGLWDREERVKFYAPSDPQHVSHSILNLQKTEHYFEANCKRLSSLLKENGHTSIDLLKLDIEGAEYGVLRSIAEDQVDIGILCVEFDEIHHPLDPDYRNRVLEAVEKLHALEYVLVSAESTNYTFIKGKRLPQWIPALYRFFRSFA